MPIDALFAEIESTNITAVANLASGYTHFVRITQQLVPAKQLMDLIANDRSAVTKVLGRIQKFASMTVDTRYEHPHDVALSIYLKTLQAVDPELAASALIVIDQVPNTWWAQKTARASQVVNESSVSSTKVNVDRTLAVSPSDSSETLLIGKAAFWSPSSQVLRVRSSNKSDAMTKLTADWPISVALDNLSVGVADRAVA